ncbi:MAG: HAD hydrolase-like protein [Desulfovibrio sp.]|nr:HAD hydrolase-like protein [Desulfovibrio sp.]
MAIECLVFDCDGVILDSVPVKTRAFRRLAEPYGEEAADRFVIYHSTHGGVSRYKKFEWFFDEILKRPIQPDESEEWGEKFEKYALEEVRKCPMIPGAMDALRKWHGVLPMYVCSGAPDEEVNLVLSERNLSRFFTGIYGTPPAKAQLLEKIARSTSLDPADIAMVGDSTTDLDAAEYVGTLFYGVGNGLKGGAFPWSETLENFNAWVEANRR